MVRCSIQAGKNVTASTVRTTISADLLRQSELHRWAAASAGGDGCRCLLPGLPVSRRSTLDVVPFLSVGLPVPKPSAGFITLSPRSRWEPRRAPPATPELRTLAKSGKEPPGSNSGTPTENLLRAARCCAASRACPAPCRRRCFAAPGRVSGRSTISGGFVCAAVPEVRASDCRLPAVGGRRTVPQPPHIPLLTAFLSARGSSGQRLAAHALLALGVLRGAPPRLRYAERPVAGFAKQTFWNLRRPLRSRPFTLSYRARSVAKGVPATADTPNRP